ncbi:hypothetical protein B9Z55_017892 [Caenorhabditis nigoni]|uniref:Nuclear receptor domain-containing protein n=1 Tax=Caenorhabditis nigoni TaxID=1611254 RepID=A0A2G5TBL2_9PELO|nr:hypothetical protein B9Z55_017892 [Caenorhabditis nigoni]
MCKYSNLKVYCCNACKMAFFRASRAQKFPKSCLNGENCGNCRFCRYQKCIAVGMKWLDPLPWEHPLQPITPDLPMVISQLKLMDDRRELVFHSYTLMDDSNLDTLVLSTSTNYVAKSEHSHFTRHDWAAISHTTGIDFIKKFDFISLLSTEELIRFIEKAIMPYTLFCTAMRSYSNRREAAEFPGGVDVICEDLEVCYANSPAVLDNLRYPLVAKLRELKITNDEFLLMSAVTICNSVAAKLSDESRELISRYQNRYTSHLLKYCQMTYQAGGQSRFFDLLSIWYTIDKANKDFVKAMIQFSLSEPRPPPKKIFDDLLEGMMK